MLKKLKIKNFAIIKNADFNPGNGLNIITGETGSGKSILIEALNLILGQRADFKFQNSQSEKCVVEGLFTSKNPKVISLLKAQELDIEDEIIIRKEISANGKSRTFINDTPVNLNQLKSITEHLVSVHSQNENLSISDPNFHFQLLDFNQSTQIDDYKKLYKNYTNLRAKLTQLLENHKNNLKEKDYLQFICDELIQLNVQLNEEKNIEEELNVLNYAEEINQTGELISNTLTESENSILDQLNNLKSKFKSIQKTNDRADSIFKRIESLVLEVKDLSKEVIDFKEQAISDPTKIEELNSRLMLIQNVKRKHSVQTEEELNLLQVELSHKLNSIEENDNAIESIEKEVIDSETKLKILAESIHKKRIDEAQKLEKKIELLLNELEMPKSKFKYQISKNDQLNKQGITQIEVLFSANEGIEMQNLNKVASGGEISRLALCLRQLESKNHHDHCLIFDEIDTGVSGKVASTIGQVFKDISNTHQIIAITHLPQVAGYADSHFSISKQAINGITQSNIQELNKNERIDELAKMLSGEKATDIAKENAKELIKH